jgi:multidrug efflux pump subunit AcrA (membrane-fusion protein)
VSCALLVSQNDRHRQSNYDCIAQLALDQAGIDQAQAALQEARINLAYTDITSPVDGVVVSRNVDVGQTVAASFQTPTLFLIAQDLTKMQVDAAVSESDIGEVQTGQKVSFTVDAYPERTFTGVVGQVRNAPLNVANVVTYDVVVAVDNSDLALKPGMTATVSITTQRRDDVVRIPLRALRFKPKEAVSDDGVRPTPAALEVVGDDERRLAHAGGRLDRTRRRQGRRSQRSVRRGSTGEPGVFAWHGTRGTPEPPTVSAAAGARHERALDGCRRLHLATSRSTRAKYARR